MEPPKLEVADIFRRYGEAYRQKFGASLSTAQRRVMTAIEVCRTAATYDILFRATAQTLTTIAADPRHLGAEIGFFAVLHSWGQALLFHPHLHCVVPGGGLSPDGKTWISCRPGFFLPIEVLSCLFRRLFLKYLQSFGRHRK